MIRAPLVPIAKEDPHGAYIGILKSKSIAELVQKKFPHKEIKDLMRKDLAFTLSNEYFLEVYARDRKPEMAAGIANAYVENFNRLISEYSLVSQNQIQTVMEAEMRENQEKLSETMNVLNALQVQHKTINMDEESKQLIALKTTFSSQLDMLKIENKEIRKSILMTEKELKKEYDLFMYSGVAITSPFLEKLKDRLVSIETDMAGLKVEFKEEHPNFLILKKSYDEVKGNIRKEIEKILQSEIQAPGTFYEDLRRQLVNLYVDKERVRASTRATKRVLKDIEERIIELPKVKRQIDTLLSESESYKQLIASLKVNLEETKAQSRRNLQVAVLVDEATPPTKPAFPIKWLNASIACVGGIVVGIMYCFFMDYIAGTRENRILRMLRAIEASER